MVTDAELVAAARRMNALAEQVAQGSREGDAERIVRYIVADAAILLIDLANGSGEADDSMSANRFAGCVARTVLMLGRG